VKVATPDPLVATVVVPVRDAPPPIATLTLTPAWLTAFPETSCSWTAGAVASALPLATVADGCVAITSRVAAPAPSRIGPDVTLGTPLDEKSSV
jgi:hypothetical protein